jgi:CubicO group peptidase (beta-lactamase class C family)
LEGPNKDKIKIGSTTKIFTAIAILQLQEKGRLNLDDDSILKAFHSVPNQIARSSRNNPGEIISYSNLGYSLLGIVIERASGKNLGSCREDSCKNRHNKKFRRI